MLEANQRIEWLQAGSTMVVGTLALVPIERTAVRAIRLGGGWWFDVEKILHALVVHRGDGTETIAPDGAAPGLDILVVEVSGLGRRLSRVEP